MQQAADASDALLFHIGHPFANAERRKSRSLRAEDDSFSVIRWSQAKFSHMCQCCKRTKERLSTSKEEETVDFGPSWE